MGANECGPLPLGRAARYCETLMASRFRDHGNSHASLPRELRPSSTTSDYFIDHFLPRKFHFKSAVVKIDFALVPRID
jgi:hypothetical protein